METLSLLAVNALNGGGGGGGGDVTPDGVTTEFNASEELQANAVIHVNALPSSGIKDSSLYHVNETVTYTVDGDTETFTMSKFFRHESGAWVSYTTISGLTQADYDHLTAAQKADGTNYIVNGGGRVTRMVYAALDGKPTLNSVTIDGDLTLEDINVYSIDEVDDLLAQKVAAEFVDELPATLVSNTWYYSKEFADGTLVPNDNRALYVLDADDVLQYMGVVGQVELDGYYTKGESDGRYYTKTDSDARYYTKTDSDDRYYTQTDADAKFQEKITDSTTTTLTDSSLVSSLSASAKTNARFSLASLWTWLTGKLKTAVSSSLTNTDIASGKAVYDYAVPKTTSASKVYGTNGSGDAYNFDRATSVSSSSTDAQFPTAKAVYSYSVPKTSDSNRVYGSSTNYTVTDTYTSTASNQLLTRAGAYNLYNNVFLGQYCCVFCGNVTRNSTQSVNSNTWTAISLTGSDVYRTGLISLASNGVKILKAGTYRFEFVIRLADTASATRHWCVSAGTSSAFDDSGGGQWLYTYFRHKAEASHLRYCAANEVIKPYVYIDSNAGTVQFATVRVFKLNEK
jgi:hypothetical protein